MGGEADRPGIGPIGQIGARRVEADGITAPWDEAVFFTADRRRNAQIKAMKVE